MYCKCTTKHKRISVIKQLEVPHGFCITALQLEPLRLVQHFQLLLRKIPPTASALPGSRADTFKKSLTSRSKILLRIFSSRRKKLKIHRILNIQLLVAYIQCLVRQCLSPCCGSIAKQTEEDTWSPVYKDQSLGPSVAYMIPD